MFILKDVCLSGGTYLRRRVEPTLDAGGGYLPWLGASIYPGSGGYLPWMGDTYLGQGYLYLGRGGGVVPTLDREGVSTVMPQVVQDFLVI